MEQLAPRTTATTRITRTDAVCGPAILIVTFLVYALSPVTTSTDSAWTLHLATSILRERDFDLDEYQGLMDLHNDYRLRSFGGHIYSYYPIATPLLVTPAVWLVNKIYPFRYGLEFYTYLAQHGPDERTARLEKLLASGVCALAAVATYLVARSQLQFPHALFITAIFAFGTSMWSTASRALWQHGPSVLFLTSALYLLLVSNSRTRMVLAVGILLGFAYMIRPTNSLSIIAVALYLLFNQRAAFWPYAAGLAVSLGPFSVLNLATYGNPLPPYSYQLLERLASPAAFGEAAVGTLISPARGLLIFTPVFAFCAYGLRLRLRSRSSGGSLPWYLAAVLLGHWFTTALFADWGGAWSIGPRYFVDVMPYFIYFLIPVVQAHGRAPLAWSLAFVVAGLLGVLIQFHCSTSIYPFMWNRGPQALVQAPERKWDWGDLQFLRGLCKSDPLEGHAPACWFESDE